MLTADTEIQYLKGVGPRRGALLAKLGITRAGDLLTFFPTSYQDRSAITPIENLKIPGKYCVFGKIGKTHKRSLSRGLSLLEVELSDNSGTLYLKFFRKINPYSKIDFFAPIKNAFTQNKYAYVYGTFEQNYIEKFITPDDFEVVDTPALAAQNFNKIVPVYPLTENLNQKFVRQLVQTVLPLADTYPEIKIDGTENLITTPAAIKAVHNPATIAEAELARRRLALNELFVFECALALARLKTIKTAKTQKYALTKNLLTPFKNNLPFSFTNAQKKAINDIFSDMQNPFPANRLLMGDVGSGKTVVALSAMLLAAENNYQSMLIAPTEILAAQHFAGMSKMLKNLNVEIILVTSDILKKKKTREEIFKKIAGGPAQIVIGTHALIEDRIQFKNLSLIVIDEQHRFGVMQKYCAREKADSPDILMMTATPIPRALAMTAFGEMNVTRLNELPAGRIPAKTMVVNESYAYAQAKKEIALGRQVYIVYPLIDESDKISLKSAVSEAQLLSQTVFSGIPVGLLHGKMKQTEKDEVMEKFKDKQFSVLISTTVIEVGIDVPNASVMIVHHADRFGLSSLHQLRGRIGRGNTKSYCYLICASGGNEAQQRLNAMTRTNDGFEIAEIDLQMRGPGELLGKMQHGFPEFKAANIVKDLDLIEFSKIAAAKVLENDPSLIKPENAILKSLILKNFAGKLNLVSVG
jgi:ATP-dependent DNA helicase RecG